jgi:DNA repair exonuclease SbcCD ATPase subunit
MRPNNPETKRGDSKRPMLKFLNINPTGLFSYGVSEAVDLDGLGLVHLVGVNEDRDHDSNGAGKSSLFNALCEIVWGENPTGVSGAGCANTQLGKGFCGRVEFLSGNDHYRITYSRGWKDDLYPVDTDNGVTYSGTSIYFETLQDGLWRDLRGASMAETRQAIQRVLGLTYERFMASSYLSPRAGNLLLKGTNKDRMAIMSGIVGLSSWDRILDSSRESRRGIQARVSEVEKKLAFAEGTYAQLVKDRDTLSSTDWETAAKQHEEYVVTQRVQEGQLVEQQAAVFQQIQEVTAKRSQAAIPVKNRISELNREISILESRNREPVQESPEIRALGLEIRGLEGEVSVVEGKLRSYIARDGASLALDACPTCKSRENWDSIKHSIKDQQAALEAEISQFRSQIEEKRSRLKVLVESQQQARAAYVQEGLDQEKGLRVEVSALEHELETVERAASELELTVINLNAQNMDLNSQILKVRNDINQAVSRIESYRAQIARLTELNSQVAAKAVDLAALQKVIDEANDEAGYFDWLIKHAPFIKLHKLSVSLVDLSALTNKYLSDIGESIRVNISSFSEKKKAKGLLADSLKSEIDLSITDGEKEIDPRLYSDGETSRVSLAVSRALHDMAKKGASGCNLLFMDEVFSFVDHASSQKMAGLFQFVGDTVVVTDNSGRATDLLAFNRVWTARKSFGVTKLSVD